MKEVRAGLRVGAREAKGSNHKRAFINMTATRCHCVINGTQR